MHTVGLILVLEVVKIRTVTVFTMTPCSLVGVGQI